MPHKVDYGFLSSYKPLLLLCFVWLLWFVFTHNSLIPKVSVGARKSLLDETHQAIVKPVWWGGNSVLLPWTQSLSSDRLCVTLQEGVFLTSPPHSGHPPTFLCQMLCSGSPSHSLGRSTTPSNFREKVFYWHFEYLKTILNLTFTFETWGVFGNNWVNVCVSYCPNKKNLSLKTMKELDSFAWAGLPPEKKAATSISVLEA